MRVASVALVSREDALDPSRLGTAIERFGATAMQATPATWRMLLSAGWEGGKGFKVLIGGEAAAAEAEEAAKVEEAADGPSALAALERRRPSLVVLDVMMPKMDGFEATRQIRQISAIKAIPILAASASVFESHRHGNGECSG